MMDCLFENLEYIGKFFSLSDVPTITDNCYFVIDNGSSLESSKYGACSFVSKENVSIYVISDFKINKLEILGNIRKNMLIESIRISENGYDFISRLKIYDDVENKEEIIKNKLQDIYTYDISVTYTELCLSQTC